MPRSSAVIVAELGERTLMTPPAAGRREAIGCDDL
jgi:hypothetical protein